MITTGGEGKVPSRKRVRGKIGDPSNAPELKTHNLLVNGNDDDATTYFNYKSSYGVFTNDSRGTWYPIRCYWPVEGSGSHQRIGKKIRVKFLRLKGFVTYSPYLITQVRYRVVLYRTLKAAAYNFLDFIKPMYRGFKDLSAGPSIADLQGSCTLDYYMSYFNTDYLKSHEIKRRVLYRGLIKPQVDVPNFAHNTYDVSSTTEGKVVGNIFTVGQEGGATGYFNSTNLVAGQTNVQLATTSSVPQVGYVGAFQPHVVTGAEDSPTAICNQRGFFPIDLTVTMNDNVDCTKYDYVFVVESDWAIGQSPMGEFSNQVVHSNFFLDLLPHIYYTDD